VSVSLRRRPRPSADFATSEPQPVKADAQRHSSLEPVCANRFKACDRLRKSAPLLPFDGAKRADSIPLKRPRSLGSVGRRRLCRPCASWLRVNNRFLRDPARRRGASPRGWMRP